MRAGPIAHGALLVAALGFAYQTWTRVDTEPPKAGTITVWKEPVSSFQAFAYDGERKSLRIERRGKGDDAYLWGTVTRSKKKRKKKVKIEGEQPTPSAPADPHGHGPPPTDAKNKLQELKDKASGKDATGDKPASKGADKAPGDQSKPADKTVPGTKPAPKKPAAPKPAPAKPAAGDATKAPQSPHRTETTDEATREAGEDGHGADDGHGHGDAHGDAHGEDAADATEDLPEDQYETTAREFPVGHAGVELVENLSHLRALRDLGVLSEAQKEEYGLVDTSQNLTVFFEGGVEHTLIIGNRVVGGSDRYALTTDTGKGYVLSHSEIVKHIDGSETSLGLKVLHAFQQDLGEDVEPVMHAGSPQRKQDLYAKVSKLEVKGQDAERVLVRTQTTDPKGNDLVGWADTKTPDTPDLSLANFMNQIERLKPTSYEDEVSEDQLELILSLTYKDRSGKQLGSYKLFKKPVVSPEISSPVTPALDEDDDKKKDERPDYYVVTELTRKLGKVSPMAAERVESDIPQLFGGGDMKGDAKDNAKQFQPGMKGGTIPTPGAGGSDMAPPLEKGKTGAE